VVVPVVSGGVADLVSDDLMVSV